MNDVSSFISMYVRIDLLDYPIFCGSLKSEEYIETVNNFDLFEKTTNAMVYLFQQLFPTLDRNQILLYYVKHGANYDKHYIIKDKVMILIDNTEA
jgi:ribosomal protein L16 Arg81 hydroxylase